jgi:methionyl aminopeptidase
MGKYSAKQIEYLKQSGAILHDTFPVLEKNLRVGISTLELDKIAEDYIRSRGAEPACKNYEGFKYSICASVNEESVHGMPNKNKKIKNGDIISLDVCVRYPANNPESMCTDACRTFGVGEISPEAAELIKTTKQCFDVGVSSLKAGDQIKTIGKRIEKFIDGRYGIVDSYFGHGIGHTLHEGALIANFDIDNKPNASARLIGEGNKVLCEGDIVCVEPMINIGTKDLKVAKDGWTAITADGKLACHYENTLIITKKGVEIVT